MVDARDGGNARRHPGGQHDLVVSRQVRGRRADPQSDVDAVLVEHAGEVADGLGELLLAGNPSGEVELATDVRMGLEQRHEVPALRGGHRGGQTRGTRPDDGDAPGAAGGLQRQRGLAPGSRVEQARHRFVDEHMIQAGLVAGDAGVDLVGSVGAGLAHPVGVGQQRPGHRDQADVGVGEDLLGRLGHVDAIGGDDRDCDMLGQGVRDAHERAVGHRRHDGRDPRFVPADPGVDQRRPGFLDFLCQRDDLVPALAVGDEVGHRQPVADDEVRSERRAGAAHDLDRQSSAFLGATTPRVGAPVRPWRQELVEQITFAAHDLDAVVTGLAGQRRRADEVVDRGLDPAPGQPPRPKRCGGCLDRRGARRQGMERIASRVQDLQQDLGLRPGRMHGRGDTPVPARIGARGHLGGERQQPARPVRGVAAGDDQSDTATRPLGEILGQSADVAGAVLQPGVHGSHHHAVAQPGEAEIQRGQQTRIGLGHARLSSSAVVTSSSHPTALSSARMPPRSTRYWCSSAPVSASGSGNCCCWNPR